MTKRLTGALCLALGLCNAASAQEQPEYRQLADRYFERYDYVNAAGLYKKLTGKGRYDDELNRKLAISYHQMLQYPEALEQYELYYSKDSARTDVLPVIGELLKTLQRYEDAKQVYLRYAALHPEQGIIRQYIAGCDSALRWQTEPAAFEVRNEQLLNSAYSDWGATYFRNSIVFTSEDRKEDVLTDRKERSGRVYGWTGNPYFRLYAAERPGGGGADTSVLKDIHNFGSFANNSRYHVGPAAFSEDGSTVFFTVTNQDDKRQHFSVTTYWKMKQRNLQLFYSMKDSSGNWTEPVSFAYNQPDQYSVGHAALSGDGNTLYFVSDMPGGYGKTDIWYSVKAADGSWQKPENCGSVINTEDEEAFPVLSPDGSLYFSSKGHPGFGGFDLFVSGGSRNRRTQPVNLRQPLNSSYDDFYLSTADQRSGYLSSNRPGGAGSDDIYSFSRLAPQPLVLQVILLNRNDSSPIPGGTVTLWPVSSATGKVLTADDKGAVYDRIVPGAGVNLSGSYKNFTGDTSLFRVSEEEARGKDTVVAYVYLAPPAYKVGDRFVLEDLYYDFDKYNIRPDAALVLDRLLAILEKYPGMEIELSSHTDSRGSDAYNMRLSQNRAESAVAYLISRGIRKGRIEARGYGETMHVNECSNGVQCSEEAHQMNRRTEVRILKMD